MKTAAASWLRKEPSRFAGAPELRAGLVAGGAPRLWERVLRDSLPYLRIAVRSTDAAVLEVGYGDGLLSCFLAAELGWRITGLEVRPEAYEAARAAARMYQLESQVDFRLCAPGQTRGQVGPWDAVFAKTVFYSSRSLKEYVEWLDWILCILRPGGVLINFETGRAGSLMGMYRRIRRRQFTDRCLYASVVERLYDTRFDIVWRRYYGGLSQFVAPLPGLFEAARWLEEFVEERSADSCFIAAMVVRKAEE